jgi:hypothetical protein
MMRDYAMKFSPQPADVRIAEALDPFAALQVAFRDLSRWSGLFRDRANFEFAGIIVT